MADYEGHGIPVTAPAGSVPPILSERPIARPVLRAQFDAIHEKHGTWIVLVHANHSFPCTRCGSRSEGEGDGNCPECLGLGYRAAISRDRVIFAKPKRGIPFEVDLPFGGYGDSRFRIYFPASSPIRSGDLICEVLWNTTNVREFSGEPTEILHVYMVEQAELQYFDGQPAYSVSYLDSSDNHIDPIKQAFSARRR